jgi:putative transposase
MASNQQLATCSQRACLVEVTGCYNGRFVLELLLAFLAALRVFFRCRTDLAVEVLALRQQLAVLKRKQHRPRLNYFDRLFWITLRRFWSRWREALLLVKPETVVAWHRTGFRLYWRWRSRTPRGRPKVSAEIRMLIRRMAEENADLLFAAASR